jgi:PhzF family phenazine biosynthesis protein
MNKVRFLQLDVFAARPGGGNPLGVVVGADAWSAAEMQRFAAWTNLVETTFLLPPRQTGASYRLRIFTPSREIPFAGHPTIGSAHAALDVGLVPADAGELIQDCDAGQLPILIEGSGMERRLMVQSPRAQVRERGLSADPQLAVILGSRRLGALAPAVVEGGRRWWLAELADEEQVRGWHPNHAAIAALAHASDSLGLCVFARCDRPDFDLVVRAFPAGVGIVEDPASGAANGLIAAYIADSEPDGPLGRGYRVSQGREIDHDAQILIRIEDGSIWVGGQTQTVIDGHASWPVG